MWQRVTKHVVSALLLSCLISVVSVMPAAAQHNNFDQFSGLRSAAVPAGFQVGGTTSIPLVIGRLIQYALSLVGLIFMVIIIIGYMKIGWAGGNDEEVQQGKLWIKNGAWGALIVMAAYVVTSLVLFLLKGSVFEV